MTYTTTASGKAPVNGIEIYYETFGNPNHPAVLLIMGLDAQCVMWSIDFIMPLIEAGYYVVRFDNRDIGLSTWLNDSWHRSRPYTLEDMASDAVGLLDHLHIQRAHIVGVSMGGMIAQRLAISHAERVQTLTCIMSSGYVLDSRANKNVAMKVVMKALPYLIRRVPIKTRITHHEVSVKNYVATYRMLAGNKHPFNREHFEKLFTWSILERKGQNPKARFQQYCAIVASGSRLHELSSIEAPTLILHGTADKLVPPIHAKLYAPLILNAKLVWLDGIGHELPKAIWHEVHEELLKLWKESK